MVPRHNFAFFTAWASRKDEYVGRKGLFMERVVSLRIAYFSESKTVSFLEKRFIKCMGTCCTCVRQGAGAHAAASALQ